VSSKPCPAPLAHCNAVRTSEDAESAPQCSRRAHQPSRSIHFNQPDIGVSLHIYVLTHNSPLFGFAAVNAWCDPHELSVPWKSSWIPWSTVEIDCSRRREWQSFLRRRLQCCCNSLPDRSPSIRCMSFVPLGDSAAAQSTFARRVQCLQLRREAESARWDTCNGGLSRLTRIHCTLLRACTSRLEVIVARPTSWGSPA
jgi:hypothetical protein